MTTTRVDRKTASGMLWVTNTMVVPVRRQILHELGVHPLAGHLVERPERLVHQQQLRVEGQRPGDRHPLLHAARQLPGMLVGEALELDQPEQLGRAARAARRPGKPMISSGSSMFLAIVRQSIRTGAWKTIP